MSAARTSNLCGEVDSGGWDEEKERGDMGYSESISAHTVITTTDNRGHYVHSTCMRNVMSLPCACRMLVCGRLGLWTSFVLHLMFIHPCTLCRGGPTGTRKGFVCGTPGVMAWQTRANRTHAAWAMHVQASDRNRHTHTHTHIQTHAHTHTRTHAHAHLSIYLSVQISYLHLYLCLTYSCIYLSIDLCFFNK